MNFYREKFPPPKLVNCDIQLVLRWWKYGISTTLKVADNQFVIFLND